MLRGGRLADARRGGELADGVVAPAQPVEQATPRRIRERRQAISISHTLYKHRCIDDLKKKRLGLRPGAHHSLTIDENGSYSTDVGLTLDVRHLSLVHEIAATGSVTRAAGRLHLTQSALSHQLRDVESRLGLQLFLRLGKKMVLTPAGERVLASSRRVLDELRRAEDELRVMAVDGKGVLRLCTQCNTGYHWLPPLLQIFHRRFPGIDVQIAPEATRRPIAALLSGEIDLAVATSTVDDKRLVAAPLFEDELVAIVAPKHPFVGRAFVEPADFADQQLILYTADRSDSYTFTRILTPAGVEPAGVSEVPLTEAILELVKAGLGVSVMARWAVEPSIRSGSVRAVKITRRGVRRTWTAVTLRDRPQPDWQKEFVTLLARQALPARLDRKRA
jgi:LysR family transcriptional regulator for metE and metH